MPVGALVAARALQHQVPTPSAQAGGEYEGHAWWATHDKLFAEARRELGPRDATLYTMDDARFVDDALRDVVARIRAGSAPEEALVTEGHLVETAARGVWAVRLFKPEFEELMLRELRHHEASGIPLRRPNGMNRYGAILDDLGFRAFLTDLRQRYVAPLGQFLFRDHVRRKDVQEHFGFSIRYKSGEDTSLARHADAAVLTLNACIGKSFAGGALAFHGLRFAQHPGHGTPGHGSTANSTTPQVEVAHAVGTALLHLGQHEHQALPLRSGERVNLIMWMFAGNGDVRVAPYPPLARSSRAERWAAMLDPSPLAGECASQSGANPFLAHLTEY